MLFNPWNVLHFTSGLRYGAHTHTYLLKKREEKAEWQEMKQESLNKFWAFVYIGKCFSVIIQKVEWGLEGGLNK